MAHEFGQDPFSIRSRYSERQLSIAMEWLNAQWNEPSRTDHYLMEIARAESKTASLYDHKLTFTTDKIDLSSVPPGFPKPMTKESIQEANAKYRLEMVEHERSRAGKPDRPFNR